MWNLGLLGAAGSAIASTPFEHLQTHIVSGTSTTEIVFNNLDTQYAADYAHLQLRMSIKDNAGGNDGSGSLSGYFNSHTASTDYYWHYIRGLTSVSSPTNLDSNGSILFNNMMVYSQSANVWGAVVADILDPFDTSKKTTVRMLGSAFSNSEKQVMIADTLYNRTDSVNSLRLVPYSTLTAGSRFSLYGMRAA